MFTASDVLLKAASRVEEEGMWCQGQFFGDKQLDLKTVAFHEAQERQVRTSECAMGALMSATVELGLTYDTYQDAEDLLALLVLQENRLWLNEWNDERDRTAHEVADAMRRAAL